MTLDPKTDTLWKTYLVYFLVLLFGIAIIVKIILVQTKDSKELQQLAEKQEYRMQTLEASRGNIYSSDGQLMATSIPLYDVYFDYKAVDSTLLANNIDSLCRQMAQLLPKRNAAEWKEFFAQGMAKHNRHYKIALNITQGELRQMEDFVIFNEEKKAKYHGGIISEKKIRRERPYKELASLMLGMANEEKGYYFGIEGAYNDYLKGQNGKQLVRRIHSGYVPIDSEENREAQNGDDVITTFDIKLQDIVESALNHTLTENKAEQGCAILMDVETGYVKALANLRLNHETGQYEESYNVALGERYEPGSVFKIASMVVLLNQKEDLKLTDLVNIGTGPIKFSNRVMKDDHTFTKNGICTVQEVIEQSSNKGTAVLVTRTFAAHPERYVNGLYELGLNKPIGTGITGEAQPVIKDPKDKDKPGGWSKVTLPWMSIGYEVNVTPMHLITLYNAIANGGRMMKPQFVSEVRRGTQTIEKFEPIVLNEHIASPEAIDKLQTMLEGVAIRGTAKRQFEGCVVNVAGKTGTAQYYDRVQGYAYHEPGIGRKLYNTTFVGYFPAEKPRYSCIVMVSRARGRYWAAGGVSAPGFREIAEKVYAMRIGTQDDDTTKISTKQSQGPIIVRHDKETNYLKSINRSFTDLAINGDWVTVERTEDGETRIREARLSDNIVPDVVGMDITDAVYLLENMGLKAEFSGQGTIKEQSLRAGDTIKGNSVIHLKLEKK